MPKKIPTPTLTTDFTTRMAFTIALSPHIANPHLTIFDWDCYDARPGPPTSYHFVNAENVKNTLIALQSSKSF
jgi:hypothetical protein